MTDEMGRILIDIVAGSSLQRLDLSQNALTEETLRALAELLSRPKCQLSFIRYIVNR